MAGTRQPSEKVLKIYATIINGKETMIKIVQTVKDNFQIIQLEGRLDSNTSPELSDFMKNNDFREYRGVILEMTKLNYISSAGLRVLLNSSKEFKTRNADFTLCGMQDHIREVFEISGFDTFLRIYTTLEEALQ